MINSFSIKYLGSFLLFFLWCDTLLSQNNNLRFQHLTIEDGLPQNMVDCMIQDSQGFIWIGTWNGLSRYDGYSFEVFDSGSGFDNELINNFIHALYEDLYGNIWIGTKQGLYVFLYDQERFIRAEFLLDVRKDLLNDPVYTIAAHGDSEILIGTSSGLSVLKILDETSDLTLLRHFDFGDEPYNLNGSVVNKVVSDSRGNIWIGTNQGLNIISGDYHKIKHFVHEPDDVSSISSNQVLSIYEASDKTFWVGTEFGLNRFNPENQNFDRFMSNPSQSSTIGHNTIMDIIEDDYDNIILATLGGLSLYNTETEKFQNYRHKLNVNSISNNFVNCLFKDNSGNIWMGTERGGITYFTTYQNALDQFVYEINNPNSLTHNTINSIYEDDQFIWIGTAGGGLNRYDKRNKKYKHYLHNPQDQKALSSDFITSIFRDKNKNLWIGTWGGGLNLLRGEGTGNEYFVHFNAVENEEGLASNFISSIIQDQAGKLWIGTLRGVSRYNIQKNQFDEITSVSKGISAINEVGCMLVDSEERLWIGTRSGLYEFNFSPDYEILRSIKKYESNRQDKHSLSGNYIISLLEDSDSNIWVGSYGQGLNKLIKGKDGKVKFESYTTKDGLGNNIIYGIVQDKNADLWMSTDYGLSRFDPKSATIQNYYQHHGLLNNQYYWSSLYINDHGKIYAGGMNGLDSFYPEWLKENDFYSKVLITDVSLLNNSIVPGQKYNGTVATTKSVSKTDVINLSYKEKQIGIEFSSLNYHENGLLNYQYILEGFDKDWNIVDSRKRYASYTNLSPGEYRFIVRNTSPDGAVVSKPTVLKINISTPFWDTLWFQGLVFITLIGLVFGYIRLRTYTLKMQKLLLEKQVEERTEKINLQKNELSEQAQKLKSANIELEKNQKLVEGQNLKLENQNREILTQRDKLIELNNKVKMVSQLRLSFFTNISHEFRTPLTLIIGPIEKLIKEKNLNKDAKETLVVINRNAQRLLHLINQIMDFRKIEKGRMELQTSRSDLSSFCNSIFEAFKPLSKLKKINFKYTEDDLPEEIWYDANKMENILYNLLSNAFKYTSEGGSIELKIRGLFHHNSKLKLDSNFENVRNIISISVIDNGIGISKENLPLIFKKFYRIESAQDVKIQGSGIGLALTEELIKTHHGDIFVESKFGAGSIFEVQFPCLKGFYELDEIKEMKPEGLSMAQQVKVLEEELTLFYQEGEELEVFQEKDSSKPTILLVEDNLDLRKFIVHRLRDNYRMMEASNGSVGIKLAKKYNPDLIISDIMMPEVDGLELCIYIKNNLKTSHIPVILLTAKSSEEHEIEGFECGADEYLSKPFTFEILEVRIKNLLESRKKLRLLYIDDHDAAIYNCGNSKKDQEFLTYASGIIDDNISNPAFGVNEFLKEMGISRSLLHKKLTSLVNQSANEFINHSRMKKARRLLIENRLNISEVAYEVGYNDPKYFSRLFSKTFGQSPKEFQHEILVKHRNS